MVLASQSEKMVSFAGTHWKREAYKMWKLPKMRPQSVSIILSNCTSLFRQPLAECSGSPPLNRRSNQGAEIRNPERSGNEKSEGITTTNNLWIMGCLWWLRRLKRLIIIQILIKYSVYKFRWASIWISFAQFYHFIY